MTWEYGKPLIGVALGEERLFSGHDADWDTSWNPSQPGATATLWRYMSFAKFCSLLEREALFFSLVGKMADRYEGFVYPPQPREHGDRLREAESIAHGVLQESARNALVSCWTESGHESSLMWEAYAGDEGVAVRTTFEDLQESIRSVAEVPVTFGQVEYVDYREREVPRFGWAPLFHKRIEYHGEDEVRAILPGPPFKVGKTRLDPDVAEQGGRYVSVDLDNLVKEIRVPPHSARWRRGSDDEGATAIAQGRSLAPPRNRIEEICRDHAHRPGPAQVDRAPSERVRLRPGTEPRCRRRHRRTTSRTDGRIVRRT